MNEPKHKERNFETRLKYINEIFSNILSPNEIMKTSITVRLNITYEKYLSDLDRSMQILLDKDKPVSILKRAE